VVSKIERNANAIRVIRRQLCTSTILAAARLINSLLRGEAFMRPGHRVYLRCLRSSVQILDLVDSFRRWRSA
jgi:hypothetical protein